MVNFGLLGAEIRLIVWGTSANFNGFGALAALLHGSQVVSVSQTLQREQRAPPMFGRATITLGIGPHSSSISYSAAAAERAVVKKLAATLWWFTATPKPLKYKFFWWSPSPQGSQSPYILGDTTRPGHVTCVLV